MEKPADHILVIFGASGDLTQRKLIPALSALQTLDLLPERFAVLGIGRTPYDDQAFREAMGEGQTELGAIAPHLHYLPLDPEDSAAYASLADRLETLWSDLGSAQNAIFYLATPPSLYATIPANLAQAGLLTGPDQVWRRVVVEKPFGTDLQSARSLNAQLQRHLSEDQLYRIDHYLGKETVQNILVTRFSNGIFEPLWNRCFVHHVEITSAEDLGVDTRGGYYDQAGALRDMLQNHLLQLVGMVAMEPPTVIQPNAIRNEVLKVFQAFRPITGDQVEKQVVRGQYVASTVGGQYLPGYREAQGVPESSRTETYVALKLFIDNWRWGGVPFYIRTGKRLPTRVAEVVIHFHPSPHALFGTRESGTDNGNQLVIRIQPDEGLLLRFGMKVPGAGFVVRDVGMDFHYSNLADSRIPDAYQRLLLDCMQGDGTLFARGDAVEAAWSFVDPILSAWQNNPDIPLHGYPCGTWGPEDADRLVEGPDHTWRYPCKNLSGDGEYCEL